MADAHDRAVELEVAVRALLGIDPDAGSRVLTSLSGSVSIERVLVAARHRAFALGAEGVDLIILEPCIDIFRLMATDFEGFRVIPVVGFDADESLELLVHAIERSAMVTSRNVVVCLESPRNPVGTFFSERHLEELAAVCGDVGALLIVDHCFLLAGVQEAASIPALFRGPRRACQWIALWDTGKTIDLSGDKLGFVIVSDTGLGAWVESSIAAVQVATPIRSLSVFAELLGHPTLPAYVDHVRAACRANLDRLVSGLPSGWSATVPSAGSMSCLTCQGSELDSECLRDAFFAVGVSSVTSRAFFSVAPSRERSFVRVALARDERYFAAATDRIVTVLGALQ